MSSSATPLAALPNGPMPLYGDLDITFQPRASMPGAAACAGGNQNLTVGDWDLMFDAVLARLMLSVGECSVESPALPPHSSELRATAVQAVVLDCVRALEHLRAALEQERSQRPTS